MANTTVTVAHMYNSALNVQAVVIKQGARKLVVAWPSSANGQLVLNACNGGYQNKAAGYYVMVGA